MCCKHSDLVNMRMMGYMLGVVLFYCLSSVAYSAHYMKDDHLHNYETKYIRQLVDHFNFATENVTYEMRYLVADQYWDNAGGPILFYTGNEGDITWFCNNTGFMWDIAPKLKAMLVFAEHRYYGKSLPFGKKCCKDPKYLGFLTSEQALADYAILVKFLRETVPGAAKSPVIALGGSYGGMLAAWFRMKYPHIVQGSIAASAPILQFTNITPCDAFNAIVTADFKNADKSNLDCAKVVKKSWDVINRLAKTDSGLKQLTALFHLCEPLSQAGSEVLKDLLMDAWGTTAMVDYPYPANFITPMPAWPVKVMCSYMTNSSLPDDELIAQVNQALSVYTNYSGQAGKCLNLSQEISPNLGTDMWGFQACTEMVMPMCSDGVHDMFEPSPWDFKLFSEMCHAQWKVYPRPNWATTLYGARNLKAASNIVFSNGLLDPWSGGGVRKSISPSLPAILIADGAHHLDMRHSNPLDPQSVIIARAKELYYINQWISQYYNNYSSQVQS